ncbi:hypothetical protein AB5J62_44070 [Amycolatopsis sp. cg5]|uniref:hypothetical protein n=1 Tax=Amycolatopsis sp. cg5 TaxID=3238802 RepID=UPI0035235340
MAEDVLGAQLKAANRWVPISAAFLAVGVLAGAVSVWTGGWRNLPSVLFLGGSLAALQFWWFTRPVRALRLRSEHFRAFELAEGSVLAAGAKVSIRLPDGGWAVFRTFTCNRLLIAGLRKAWVVGPDKQGKLVVVVPGMATGWLAKVAREPAPGSTPLFRSPEPTSPREDPVVRAYWLYTQMLTALLMVAYVAVVVWMTALSLTLAWPLSLPPLVLTVVVVVTIVVAFVKTLLWGRSTYAEQWTELAATLDGPIKHSGTAVASAAGQVQLPDGRVVRVKFARTNLNLLANIEATGRMWVFGEPRPGKAARIGLPGYPLLGNVKLR